MTRGGGGGGVSEADIKMNAPGILLGTNTCAHVQLLRVATQTDPAPLFVPFGERERDKAVLYSISTVFKAANTTY